jgi:UDP-glucuronate 4-epimerase
MDFQPMQTEDVPETDAYVRTVKAVGYKPGTLIEVGVKQFVDWYVEYYQRKL